MDTLLQWATLVGYSKKFPEILIEYQSDLNILRFVKLMNVDLLQAPKSNPRKMSFEDMYLMHWSSQVLYRNLLGGQGVGVAQGILHPPPEASLSCVCTNLRNQRTFYVKMRYDIGVISLDAKILKYMSCTTPPPDLTWDSGVYPRPHYPLLACLVRSQFKTEL